MKSLFRPFLVLVAALPLVLAACGDKEPEQRAAFTQFLQTRIVDKPGVRVPTLTDEEKKSFGDYAAHYAVITDFNSSMDASVKPLSGIMQKGAVRSLNDILTRRDDLKNVQTSINDMGAALKEQKAKADAARAQLKQPDDLKAVYDKAYDRSVAVPAAAFKDTFPAIDGMFDSVNQVADYLEKHRSDVKISGAMMEVNNPKIQAELQALLTQLNNQGRAVNDAQSKLLKAVSGG